MQRSALKVGLSKKFYSSTHSRFAEENKTQMQPRKVRLRLSAPTVILTGRLKLHFHLLFTGVRHADHFVGALQSSLQSSGSGLAFCLPNSPAYARIMQSLHPWKYDDGSLGQERL
jgi:hypothetical protein